ncbi:hypothetical protein MAFF211491_48920 (plasmid) [Ralstonia solanacearum]|nr:hypothetical protein MAFF211491_48920 [Ralstonia solanacearum]BCM14658.1 hypothetical protein MAFF241648_38480 [Ralstonia solanacearum]BCN13054.1 hypothetical protein RPSD_49390 [Ralstonia solanacearum]
MIDGCAVRPGANTGRDAGNCTCKSADGKAVRVRNAGLMHDGMAGRGSSVTACGP